jgi:cytochrome c oxidase assembly factor CtaG
VHATWLMLRSWEFDPFLGISIIVVTALYLAGVRTVNRRGVGRRWPVRCTACFLSAVAVAWIVLLGPIGAWDDTFFWAHMVQHIALMMIVAPLLLLGSPVLLVLRVSPPAVRRRWIVPVLRSRAAEALTHPVVGWVLFAGVLVGTHFSPFYEAALTHPWIHDYVEHPLFLVTALIYYYPLLPGNPGPRKVAPAIRVASLFLMMFPETMTGFFIYSASFLMYPFYGTVDRPFGPNPLHDQQLGGALMWAGAMIVDSVWVVLAVRDWLHSESQRAQRIDVRTLAELGAR